MEGGQQPCGMSRMSVRHVPVPDATLSGRHASGHRGEVGPESAAAGLLESRWSADNHASPRARKPGMSDIKHRSDSPSVTHRRHKQDIHAHKSCRQQVASSAPLHRRQAYVYHSKFDATARPMDKKRCPAPSTNDMPEQASPARCIAYCQAAALSASIARGKMADGTRGE